MITLKEIYPAIDPGPLWINENGSALHYENKNGIPPETLEKAVIYITADASGELTIEL